MMFWLRFLRLLGSMAWEGAYNLACMIAFLLPGRRAAVRGRVRELMSHPMKQRIWTFLAGCGLLAGVVAGGTGCTSGAGGSFSRRVDDTVWSVEAVFDQRGELESLPGDLAFYFYSPEWGQLSDSFSLWGW